MPRASLAHGRARAAAATTPIATSTTTTTPRRPPALLLSSSCAATAASSSNPMQRQNQHHQHQQQRPIAAARSRRRSAAAAANGADAVANAANAPLPAPLQRIVSAFQAVPDPMARYKQLLFYAAKLPGLPEDLRTPENKVEGCVSQVWVVPELRTEAGGDSEGGRAVVYWRADSDSQLTKGLAALLVTGLSGCSPQEILSVTPGFIEALGLKQSLTPSRNNGFLNMLRKMQRATLELAASSGSGAASAAAPP